MTNHSIILVRKKCEEAMNMEEESDSQMNISQVAVIGEFLDRGNPISLS